MLKNSLKNAVIALVSLTLISSICFADGEVCSTAQACLIGIPIIGGGFGCIALSRCEPKEPKEPSQPKEPKEPRERPPRLRDLLSRQNKT